MSTQGADKGGAWGCRDNGMGPQLSGVGPRSGLARVSCLFAGTSSPRLTHGRLRETRLSKLIVIAGVVMLVGQTTLFVLFNLKRTQTVVHSFRSPNA